MIDSTSDIKQAEAQVTNLLQWDCITASLGRKTQQCYMYNVHFRRISYGSYAGLCDVTSVVDDGAKRSIGKRTAFLTQSHYLQYVSLLGLLTHSSVEITAQMVQSYI